MLKNLNGNFDKFPGGTRYIELYKLCNTPHYELYNALRYSPAKAAKAEELHHTNNIAIDHIKIICAINIVFFF